MFWRSIRAVLLVPLFLQGSIVVERAVASLISVRLIAGVDYARLISDTATTLIAAPLGLLALSGIARLDDTDARKSIGAVSRNPITLMVPISVVIAWNAHTLVSLLYALVAFDKVSVSVTAQFLTGLSLGLFLQMSAYVLPKALNARGRNRIAAISYVANAVAMIAFDLLFYFPLGPIALGLGASAGALVQYLICAYALKILAVDARSFLWTLPGVMVALVIGIAFEQLNGVWFGVLCATAQIVVLSVVLLLRQETRTIVLSSVPVRLAKFLRLGSR